MKLFEEFLNDNTLEILKEAISKEVNAAFMADTNVFPIVLIVRGEFNPQSFFFSIFSDAETPGTGRLKNLDRLVEKRFSSMAKRMQLNVTRVTALDIKFKFGSDAVKLAEEVGKKLKMKPMKAPSSLQDKRFNKEYNSLEDLARDLDKIK